MTRTPEVFKQVLPVNFFPVNFYVHPFFVGTQFHPEFHARPLSPHPLFTAFIKASYEHKRG